MSLQGKIKRYYLILEKISKSRYPPTFDEIKSFVREDGFPLSSRTFERDLNTLRYEFGMKIDYNKASNAYSVDLNQSPEAEVFLRLLNTAVTAGMLLDGFKDYRKLADFIQMDAGAGFQGIERLKDLMFALKNHREISFDYLAFYREEVKRHTLQPCLLKEYLNRWYIIGKDKAADALRTFGIDRISKLQIETLQFIPDKDFNPKKLFEHTIGLDYNYAHLEKVLLRFTHFQANYIKTQPWHPSQVVTEEEEGCLVELSIIPNYEFIQRILMQGSDVEVLQPQWLRDEVKKILKETLAQYGKNKA